MRVGNVRLLPAGPRDRARGLLGWLRFDLDGRLRVQGVALRKTRRGDLRLAYPARDDRWARRHFFLRPLDDRTRRAVERQVLASITRRQGAAR